MFINNQLQFKNSKMKHIQKYKFKVKKILMTLMILHLNAVQDNEVLLKNKRYEDYGKRKYTEEHFINIIRTIVNIGWIPKDYLNRGILKDIFRQ